VRKALAISIACQFAPATFPGMPVRVWDGVAFQERTIVDGPARGWWVDSDAWVAHPANAHVREGIVWAHNRWHLTTTVVETAKISPSLLVVAEVN
jgi:hypothetical protein